MTKQDIIDGFLFGDMGQVEFFEAALEAGLSLEEIEQVLKDREEDL